MFDKIHYLVNYFKYIKNPISALKFKFGLIDSCSIRIKNYNDPITLFHVSSLNSLMASLPKVSNEKLNEFIKFIVDIDYDEEYVFVNGIKFINVHNSNFLENNKHHYSVHLEEFFTGDEWGMVDFSGRHVVDIGGNVGDTALYFAQRGGEVICFEPVKHLHDVAVANVSLNNFNNIILVNKGVGAEHGSLTFESESVRGYVDNESYEMEIISFEELLRDYDFSPDILKMDCEGCEFGIIEKYDLTMFKDIIFEHHSKWANKDYNVLIDRLKKQGFKIDCYNVNVSGLNFEDLGIIHAYK